jgi:hypothetical protein
MRVRRRLPLAILAMVFALALSACDPWPVPDRTDEAWVDVDIGSDGSGTAQVFIAYSLRGQLDQVGREIAPLLFPGRHGTVGIDPNDSGAPFILVRTPNAYEPGPHPSYAWNSSGLIDALNAHGFTRIRLAVCAPAVPTTVQAEPPGTKEVWCWVWHLPHQTAPTLTVAMHPQPSRWWGALSLLMASLAATALLALAVGRRWPHPHRWLVVGIAAIGLVAAGIGVVTAAAVQGDNAGVAGILHGTILVVATVAPVLVVPAIVALVALLVVYLVLRQHDPPRRTA